jgi:hypothetical protein
MTLLSITVSAMRSCAGRRTIAGLRPT